VSEELQVDDLVALCENLLPGCEPTPDSNFFAIGGDSFTAVTFCTIIEERWGITIDPVDVLSATDLRELHEGRMGDAAAG
jgi:acyl carrier protein